MVLRAPKFLMLLLSLASMLFAFIARHSASAPFTLLLFGVGMVCMASFSRRQFANED